jgi:hypothetical protein
MTGPEFCMPFSVDFSPECSCFHCSSIHLERIPIVIPLIPVRPHNEENRDEEPGIDEPCIPGDPGDEPDDEEVS